MGHCSEFHASLDSSNPCSPSGRSVRQDPHLQTRKLRQGGWVMCPEKSWDLNPRAWPRECVPLTAALHPPAHGTLGPLRHTSSTPARTHMHARMHIPAHRLSASPSPGTEERLPLQPQGSRDSPGLKLPHPLPGEGAPASPTPLPTLSPQHLVRQVGLGLCVQLGKLRPREKKQVARVILGGVGRAGRGASPTPARFL